MKNEKFMVNLIFLTKDYEAFRAYFLKSVGELQGIEVRAWTWRALVGALNLPWPKQVYKKVDHITTWLVGVLLKFWQF